MKICKDCMEIKPLSDFHKQKRSPDGYNVRCSVCKNKKENNRYKSNKAFIHRYKLFVKCQKCGYNKSPYALEFSHIDSDTKWARSDEKWSHGHGKAVKLEWSRKRIKEEIRKCKVLCANCHREETYE